MFSQYSILFFFFLFVFILLKTVSFTFSTSNSSSNLPPGPWKLPFIGNLHQLVAASSQLPHHALRDLAKKYGPLMHLQIGEIPTVVVSSPEIAKRVMKTHDVIFASRPHNLASKIMSYDSKSITFAPCDDYWRRIRKICILEFLSNKPVRSLHRVRQEETSNLIRRIAALEGLFPINFTKEIYSTICNITSRAIFGKKNKDKEEFMSVINEIQKVASGFSVADVYPSSLSFLHSINGMKSKLENLHKKADMALEKIIHEHEIVGKSRKEADKDLVYVLLKLQEEIYLTTDAIKAVLLDIFVAGIDTSATTVDWAMSEMLRNPRIMKRAQDEVRRVFDDKGYIDESNFNELKYLKSVIKETLRMHPPAPLLLPRECQDKCEINGYDIPKKTQVIVNAWAMGRDPNFWEDTEWFKPERFLDNPMKFRGNNLEYIPFGSGRRMCPGISFGMANIEMLLAQILFHFDWKLHNCDELKKEEVDMTEVFGMTVRRKDDLYLIAVVSQPFLS